jgi:ATP-dependent Lon protease
MLLDELDKMGADSRGDPAAAMLEVLDPEQNHAFTDHYLGVPFDLSRVTFLATANDARTIPAPLWDRLEMIEVPGYTREEKHGIAMRHVVPRVLDEHGLLHPPRLRIPEGAVEIIVKSYTREAGVRGLQRCLAALCRAAAVHVAHVADAAAAAAAAADNDSNNSLVAVSLDTVEADTTGRRSGGVTLAGEVALAPALAVGPDGVPVVTQTLIERVLGPPRYNGSSDLKARGDVPGVVAGLSWTAVGGDLMYIESALMPGRGELQLTGQLGDVIRESALIAMSWVQSHAGALGLTAPSAVVTGTSGGMGPALAADIAGGGGKGTQPPTPGMYAAGADDTSTHAPRVVSFLRGGQAVGIGSSGGGDGGHIVGLTADATNANVQRHSNDGHAVHSVGAAGSPPPLLGDGLLRGRSVHIHLPQGAIPKDGPSAGVTMCTALVSLFSGRPVRCDTPLTRSPQTLKR